MTETVLRVVTATERDATEVNEDVVQMLEHLLERAKSGMLLGMAVATVEADGTCGTAFTKYRAFHKLIGAVAILQHRLIVEDNPL